MSTSARSSAESIEEPPLIAESSYEKSSPPPLQMFAKVDVNGMVMDGEDIEQHNQPSVVGSLEFANNKTFHKSKSLSKPIGGGVL